MKFEVFTMVKIHVVVS